MAANWRRASLLWLWDTALDPLQQRDSQTHTRTLAEDPPEATEATMRQWSSL